MRIIITIVILLSLHFGLAAQNEPTLDVIPNPFFGTNKKTMTRHTLILAAVILTTSKSNVFGQCSVNLLGSNPIWCLPCNGVAWAILDGAPPFNYSWSTGATTLSIDSLCAGTYIFTMIDSSGCIAIDSLTLSQPSAMAVSITTTPASCQTCPDGCMTIIPLRLLHPRHSNS